MATVDQVIHREPVPPSYLQPRIPRDLETICLKCLEKDASKRYASAEDLADDLGRYLEQRPILARRTSVVARAWKWSKRRPTAAALIAVALLSAVGFLVGSQWYSTKLRRQRDVAESDYRQTMRTMEKVLADIDLEQLVYDPGQEQRRRPQVEAALGLYQQFLSHWAHDARLRTDTAHAYRKLGDIELWLGDHAKAQAAYGNAIKTYELLRSEDQDRPEYRRWQAYCWNFLGETHRRMSQPQDAESAYEKAIQLQKPLASEPSALADDHRELARSYYNLGILYRETNRADDAEKLLRQAIEFLEKLVQEHPRQPDYHGRPRREALHGAQPQPRRPPWSHP
jgi:tetratricopeptide (TPR) repeat protein